MGKKNIFSSNYYQNNSSHDTVFEHNISEHNYSNIQQNSFDFLADKSNSINYNNYSNIISNEVYPFNKENKFSFFNSNKCNFNNHKKEP